MPVGPELERCLIGITTGLVTDPHHPRFAQYASPWPYVEAINRAGGTGVLLPFPNELSNEVSRKGFASACRQMKGIVIIGGNDIDAGFYGKSSIPGVTEEPCIERDLFELSLVAKILDKMESDEIGSAPALLGICRGMQAINIARGGTLRQDVPTEPDLTVKVIHQAPNGDPSYRHSATIDRASRLGSIVLPHMAATFDVNSFHHQGVEDLGAHLKPVAEAEDGLYEAIEDTRPGRFVLGVQWHPETMEEFACLFEALVDAANGQRLAAVA
jgi:gamma-glutamyl-gamma-aminobutyrate hydrolase PuuD